jgi:predicted transcriptional regulator
MTYCHVLDFMTIIVTIADMAKRSQIRPAVSEQLRAIVKSCGVSQYRIAKETGIDQSAMSRFVAGERGLSIEALDRLGEFLDLEVVSHRPKQS